MNNFIFQNNNDSSINETKYCLNIISRFYFSKIIKIIEKFYIKSALFPCRETQRWKPNVKSCWLLICRFFIYQKYILMILSQQNTLNYLNISNKRNPKNSFK